jgi:hypothetical protein
MSTTSPEDRFIQQLIILASTGLVLGLLVTAVVVTFFVSANINILQWME